MAIGFAQRLLLLGRQVAEFLPALAQPVALCGRQLAPALEARVERAIRLVQGTPARGGIGARAWRQSGRATASER
jgi:hypothetical protein